ncbi:molybdopterin synthase sulfur carrier subunit [Candidatus Micrarchaeota archaeon]|nr:MAG: molybdopterin synthase sulfur carrier subunit [Candidatus Micrarchaeota archaeon]
MRVKIELYATLREKFKRKEIEVDAADLREALQTAAESLGSEFLEEIFDNDELRRDRIIIVNGEIIRDIERLSSLRNAERIAIFPPLVGG